MHPGLLPCQARGTYLIKYFLVCILHPFLRYPLLENYFFKLCSVYSRSRAKPATRSKIDDLDKTESMTPNKQMSAGHVATDESERRLDCSIVHLASLTDGLIWLLSRMREGWNAQLANLTNRGLQE